MSVKRNLVEAEQNGNAVGKPSMPCFRQQGSKKLCKFHSNVLHSDLFCDRMLESFVTGCFNSSFKYLVKNKSELLEFDGCQC